MKSQERADLLMAIEELCERYPHWRLGQLVANVAGWVDQEIWDVEDEVMAAARLHLGEGQVIIYPWTDLSTKAANGENRSCVESVGFPQRIESWKALWNVTIRCFSKVPIASRATSGVCSWRKWP